MVNIVQFFHSLCQGKMEVEQLNLAVEVRTGERDERLSRHADVCCDWVGSTHRGVGLRGLIGDCGKDFLGIVK